MSAELETLKIARLTTALEKVRARNAELNRRHRKLLISRDGHKSRADQLKVDLDRARRETVKARRPPTRQGRTVTDLEIAHLLIADLHERLVTSAGRTNSRAAAGALRIAAREVATTRQQLAERARTEEAA